MDNITEESKTREEELLSRCANCWQCFNEQLNRVFVIDENFSTTSSIKKAEYLNHYKERDESTVNAVGDERESQNKVSIVDALSVVYGLPLHDDVSPEKKPADVGAVWQNPDECSICEKCSVSLAAFYYAYQQLRLLAHEASYISKGLAQLHNCIRTRYHVEADKKTTKKAITGDKMSVNLGGGADKKAISPGTNVGNQEQKRPAKSNDRDVVETKPIEKKSSASTASSSKTSTPCDVDEMPCELEIVKIETLRQVQVDSTNCQHESASPQKKTAQKNKAKIQNRYEEDHTERGTTEIILANGRVVRASTRSRQIKQPANLASPPPTILNQSAKKPAKGKQVNKQKDISLARPTAKIEAEIESMLMEICNDIYYTEENLKTLQDGKFLCPEIKCCKAFKGLKTLNKHALSHKELKRSYHCIKCDSEFSDRQQIKLHVQQLHLPSVPTTGRLKTGKRCVKIMSASPNSLTSSSISRSTAVLKKYATMSTSASKLDKNYKCEHCDKIFLVKSIYEKHLTSHNIQAEQCQCRCTLCNQLFPTVLSLARHINNVHHSTTDDNVQPVLNYACSKCPLPRSFSNYLELKSHFEAEHKERLNFCTKCGNTFSTLYHLRRHYRNVHRIEPTMAEEESNAFMLRKEETVAEIKDNEVVAISEPEFFFRELLDTEQPVGNQENKNETGSKVGTASRLFKCTQCNKEFKRKHQLNIHILFHNETDPHFGCSQCPKKFFQPNALRTHMLVHTQTNPLLCKQCDKVFERRDHFKRHMKLVHDKNRENMKRQQNSKKERKMKQPGLTCSECQKTFSRKEYLRLHMRIHTGEKPHTCDTCGKEFRDPRNLVQHLVTHKTDRPFCCSVCGLTFKRAHHLQDHEGTHRQNIARPFMCAVPYCGKTFKLRKHLVSHELVHSGSKDHTCHVCGRSFSRKDNLRQHINKIHGKKLADDLLVVVEEQRERFYKKQTEELTSHGSHIDQIFDSKIRDDVMSTLPTSTGPEKNIIDDTAGDEPIQDTQTGHVSQSTPDESTTLDFAMTSCVKTLVDSSGFTKMTFS